MDTKELRKAAKAVYFHSKTLKNRYSATEESIAKDLSDKLNGAAHEIDRLRNELSVAERKVEELIGWGI